MERNAKVASVNGTPNLSSNSSSKKTTGTSSHQRYNDSRVQPCNPQSLEFSSDISVDPSGVSSLRSNNMMASFYSNSISNTLQDDTCEKMPALKAPQVEKSSFDDFSFDDSSIEDSYAEDSSTRNRYETRIGVQGDQSSARKNSKMSHQVVISLVESSDDDDLHDIIEIKDSSDEDTQSRLHCRRSVPISSDSIYAKKRHSNLCSFKHTNISAPTAVSHKEINVNTTVAKSNLTPNMNRLFRTFVAYGNGVQINEFAQANFPDQWETAGKVKRIGGNQQKLPLIKGKLSCHDRNAEFAREVTHYARFYMSEMDENESKGNDVRVTKSWFELLVRALLWLQASSIAAQLDLKYCLNSSLVERETAIYHIRNQLGMSKSDPAQLTSILVWLSSSPKIDESTVWWFGDKRGVLAPMDYFAWSKGEIDMWPKRLVKNAKRTKTKRRRKF